MIYDDVYPQKRVTTEHSKASSSNLTPGQHEFPIGGSSKAFTSDEFITACVTDFDSLLETNKEKSKRACLNEELRYFRVAVQDFNLQCKLSTISAIQFWQTHSCQLPMLSNLANVHLVARGSSVPSKSAFSSSSYIVRKGRLRIPPDNVSYSAFLKDKVSKC